MEELEAWRTHGLVMAMCQTCLRVVSYTQNQSCSMEKGERKERRKKERKGEKGRKEKEGKEKKRIERGK